MWADVFSTQIAFLFIQIKIKNVEVWFKQLFISSAVLYKMDLIIYTKKKHVLI